jgi:hypothetical protein
MLFSINIVKKWLNKMRKKLYFGGHSTFSVFYRPFYFLNVTLMRIDVLEDNWNRND